MWHQSSLMNRYNFDQESSLTLPPTEKRPDIDETTSRRRRFWYLTLFELLTVLCAAAIPIALAIYTAINTERTEQLAEQKRLFDFQQSAAIRQQELFDKFLDNIYNLDKEGYLEEDKTPWALANAYFRAAHRQWDTLRKADALQFLMEKRLIGRRIGVGTVRSQLLTDIIRLNQLNFDHVHIISQTDSLNQLNLKNVNFDQVSLNNATFLFVDLDRTSFTGARLNGAKFRDSSLTYAFFKRTQLRLTDFGNANLTGAQFIDVDLSTAKMNEDQIGQLVCINATLPNNAICNAPVLTTITTSATTPSSPLTATTTLISSSEGKHY